MATEDQQLILSVKLLFKLTQFYKEVIEGSWNPFSRSLIDHSLRTGGSWLFHRAALLAVSLRRFKHKLQDGGLGREDSWGILKKKG